MLEWIWHVDGRIGSARTGWQNVCKSNDDAVLSVYRRILGRKSYMVEIRKLEQLRRRDLHIVDGYVSTDRVQCLED